MAAVYARLVLAGKRTMDEVPERWREAVRAIVGGE